MLIFNLFVFSIISYGQLVDKELKPFYDSFYTECFRHRKKCKISSLKFDPTMQYKFQLSGFGDRKLNTAWINKSAFEGSTNDYKEMLIFHELGHVSLMRDHCNLPKSIMNQYLIPEEFYLANKKDLMVELFKGKCK